MSDLAVGATPIRAEAITIGNELLNGDLADSNTQRFGRLLRGHGLDLTRGATVPDVPDAVVDAFRGATERGATLVLVSGGLGPTEDDLTLLSAAQFAEVPMVEHGPTLERLEARFAARGIPFTDNNRRQAQVPEGAVVLDNRHGTAPCVRFTVATTTFWFFPGVPRELEGIAADHLLPWLDATVGPRPMASHTLRTFGRTESQVATLLEALPRDPRMHVAYRAHFPEIQVTLHVDDPDESARHALLDDRVAAARQLLGPIVFTETKGGSLAATVGDGLIARGETLAVAESCTGGLVGGLITEVPGASAWFLEGAVTYSNAAKTARLGVPEVLLAEHGAVSEPVARAMAEGMRVSAGATWAVAITGVAGPGGGTHAKPVGTVHFALAGPDGTTHRHRHLPWGRQRTRVVSAWAALDMVRRRIA